MARRNGKPGDYLFSDYYTGNTVYGSRVSRDYWGDWTAKKTLKRNLQEVATPLNDPYPVKNYSGSQYEQTTACDFETQPLFIGKTSRPFPQTQYTSFMGLDPGIGDASVGCTLVVH